MKDKIGVDTIIIIIAIIITAVFLIIVLANRGEPIEGSTEGEQSGLSQAIQQANDAEILQFNAKLNISSGNQSGQTVKALVTRVEQINAAGERMVTITGVDNIDESAQYNVSMGYGNDGYINSIKVEKK